ncbi:MAG: PKD domain-containing protein [Candidatus Acetothermia bacterium]|nr:PKD domain-containing protein [Candidatus Acetothermia bacterium]MDH7505962.1 CARDB domain-containing protein [Candidatus Acetothermia bacterium]
MRFKSIIILSFILIPLLGFIFVAQGREIRVTTVDDLIRGAAGQSILSGPDAGVTPASGDALIIAQGTYYLGSRTVRITVPNIAIRSTDGPGKTIIRGSSLIMEILAGGITIGGFPKGITIADGDIGIKISGGVPNVRIEGSCIVSNSRFGVDANTLSPELIVDASNNWWGLPSGPFHQHNPNGKGNAVTDRVVFTPWINEPIDDCPSSSEPPNGEPFFSIVEFSVSGTFEVGGSVSVLAVVQNQGTGVGTQTIHCLIRDMTGTVIRSESRTSTIPTAGSERLSLTFFDAFSSPGTYTIELSTEDDSKSATITVAGGEQYQEIKFTGKALRYQQGTMPGAPSYWAVDVDQVISGPRPCSDSLPVITYQATSEVWGYVDPNIQAGDKVEVYGRYEAGVECAVRLEGSTSYYIKRIEETRKTKLYLYAQDVDTLAAMNVDIQVNPLPSGTSGMVTTHWEGEYTRGTSVTLTAPASVTKDGKTYSFVKWSTHNHAQRDFSERTITVTLDTDILDATAWYKPKAEEKKPDLIIEDIWNEGTKIYYRIKNIGDGPAETTCISCFYSTVYIDGQERSRDFPPNLAPGASSTQSFSNEWLCSDPSDVIKVVADAGNHFAESNENNNAREETLSCPTKRLPDLVVEDIWWEPSEVKVGDKVTFHYRVKNQGEANAEAFGNKLFIDGDEIDISARGPLATGSSREGFFTYQWEAAAGDHEIRVEADWENSVRESNEQNNMHIETFKAGEKEKQSPVARLSAHPTTVYVGDKVTLDASASYDPDGHIDRYSFSFGDGNLTDWLSSPVYEYTYSVPGSYHASVMVADNDDLVDMGDSVVITVEATPPRPCEGVRVLFDGMPRRDFYINKIIAEPIIGGFGVDKVRVDARVNPQCGEILVIEAIASGLVGIKAIRQAAYVILQPFFVNVGTDYDVEIDMEYQFWAFGLAVGLPISSLSAWLQPHTLSPPELRLVAGFGEEPPHRLLCDWEGCM